MHRLPEHVGGRDAIQAESTGFQLPLPLFWWCCKSRRWGALPQNLLDHVPKMQSPRPTQQVPLARPVEAPGTCKPPSSPGKSDALRSQN